MIHFTGSLFTLGILSRLCRMNDALIGLIATFFDIATAVGFLLVTQLNYLLFGELNRKNPHVETIKLQHDF